MSDAARDLVADLTAIPWPMWLVLAALTVTAYLLARWTEGFDPMELDRNETPAWPTCDAHDGPRRCGRALGHDGEHVDPFTGTRYHSARWSV